jgi:hypothetical protein
MGHNSTTHLQIPSIRETHDLGFDPHPAKVKTWVEKLPLADVGRSARMIYHTLVTMNRTLIAMQHRSQILELFREPAFHITENLKKYYIGQAFPLADKNYKAAMLARELHSEMANGYKIVLSSLLINHTPVFTAGKSLIPLHRAMHYLTELLITSYQTYTPCPATTWHDIHQLHHHAELKMLDQSPIHDGHHKMPPHHNIGNLYKKILLLSIAGPYHLSQDEISRAFSALDEWAAHSALTPMLNADDPPEAYIINQDKDEPTAFLTANRLRRDKNRILSGCLALDTTVLVAHLRRIAHQSAPQALLPAETQVSPALVRRLISAWSMSSKRNLSRIPKNTTLIIGLGLKTAHHLTANNFDPNKVRTHAAQFKSRELNGADSAPPGYDIWDRSHQTAYARTQQGLTNDEDIGKSIQGMSIYATYNCKVANESAGGACLSWTGTLTTALRIGEIIAAHSSRDDDTFEWGIAVIRWMKNTTPATLEFGIQMLTPTAEAVQIRRADTEINEFLTGLLLPELKVINQAATLIVPAHVFTSGDKVVVQVNDCVQYFILHELVEDTGIFNQFRFSLAPNANESTLDSTADKQQEFESLWATI